MPTHKSLSLALLLVAAPLVAQQGIASSNAKVRAALELLKTDNAWTVQQQIELTQIPSPPFKESARAAEYKKRLEAVGLRNVRIDSIGNVIAERRGAGNGPTVVIAGHLDTVFPEGTSVTVKRDGTKLSAPGIGDDDRGLAVVLAVARAFEKTGIQTNRTVYFVGNVGEEGPGNLRGTRYLFAKELKGKIDYFISVDGTGLDVASRAVGSYRYRVTYKGPGGHSYGAFGIPNPIHAMGRAIAGIADVQVPTTPKTTFNVGIVQGGTSVNSISGEASMEVDMRSEDAASLAAVDAKVQKILRDALNAENARWTGPRAAAAKLSLVVDTMGIRPTGGQADSAPIVQTAIAAGKSLGFTVTTQASSTDANIPISLGVPGIRLGGGGRGEGAHSLGESYDDGPNGWLGPQWALLVVTSLAGIHQVQP
jgi:acetylornithine deacetylase/succinyl-diaminopimelate desuccinylase-like protein